MQNVHIHKVMIFFKSLKIIPFMLCTSCISTNDRDCVSATYKYYRFCRDTSTSKEVEHNTVYSIKWSRSKFSSLNHKAKSDDAISMLGSPLKIINKKIRYHYREEKSCDTVCYVYSQPGSSVGFYNLYALVFIDNNECIKISCEFSSDNWLKDVKNILMQNDSLHYQKSRVSLGSSQGSVSGVSPRAVTF